MFECPVALMLDAEKIMTRDKSRLVFGDSDDALDGFATVVDENVTKCDDLLKEI